MITSKICTFCPVPSCLKAIFNLLCVLDLFSERWQSTLFHIFFFFFLIAAVFSTYIDTRLKLNVFKENEKKEKKVHKFSDFTDGITVLFLRLLP